MTPLQLVASLIIVAKIVGVAVGRYPWLRMNRSTIALTSATALIAIGAISLEEAFASLDLDTLTRGIPFYSSATYLAPMAPGSMVVIWVAMTLVFRGNFGARLLRESLLETL